MRAKSILLIVGIVIIIVIFLEKSDQDIVDLIGKSQNEKITPEVNRTDFPLQLPDNFKIEVFAKDLPQARVILKDSLGNIWVSQTKQGVISLLEIQDGKLIRSSQVFQGLKNPHGMALDPDDPFLLYIAEEDKISRVRIYSEGILKKLVDLPEGGRHFTRTLGFGPDKRLYVSIGSTCDVCREKDAQYAAIYSLNFDGTDFREHATGLRNSVFFTWNPADEKMWATEMGRDRLGDDIPPDEINIVEEGKNYGWPICYGKNIHDDEFDKNKYIKNPCEEPDILPSHIDLPAHVAPLGVAFIPQNSQWPKELEGDLLVSYHGSWNRSEPVGYKVVRIKLDEKGNFMGEEDFISGWLQNGNALGRPVDILVESDGLMYLSDDKAGVIYKITYIGQQE